MYTPAYIMFLEQVEYHWLIHLRDHFQVFAPLAWKFSSPSPLPPLYHLACRADNTRDVNCCHTALPSVARNKQILALYYSCTWFLPTPTIVEISAVKPVIPATVT